MKFRSGDVANQVPGPDVFRLVGLEFDDAGVGALLESFVLEKQQKCQKVELVLIPYQLFLETYLAFFIQRYVEPNKKIHSPCQDSDPRQLFDKIELNHHG